MATTTTKLALTKPDGTDLVDIAVLNTNADKIDAASGATICTSTTRPSTPWNGQIIFETDTLGGFVYRSATSSWTSLGGSTVSSDSPATAANGDLWWDSDNGKLYIYYVDANSSQWVSVMPATTTIEVAQNMVINGAFDIWQRGTGLPTATSATTGYVADRWQMYRAGYATGGTTYKFSGPTGIQFAARVQRDAGNASAAGIALAQSFESSMSIPLQGKTITVSFYARAGANFSSAASSLNANAHYGTGTDQNISSGFTGQSSVVTQNFTLTTSWQRFSMTGTVPTTATQLATVFSYTPVGTAGAADHFEITGIQLEIGSTATNFKRNSSSIQAEFATCQRYYQIYGGAAGQPILFGTISGTSTAVTQLPLLVEMRTSPTITFPAASNFQQHVPGVIIATCSAISTQLSTSKIISVDTTGGSGFTPGHSVKIQPTGAAGLVQVSAEL